MEKQNGNPGTTQIWLAQTRANFLLLAVVLVFVSAAAASEFGGLKLDLVGAVKIFLLLLGVVSAHVSVNLFNEYSDYKTGIDFSTIRNPFSGGSGMLPQKFNDPAKVKRAAFLTLFLGLAVGLYFIVASHWILSVFIVVGALTIVLYTDYLAKAMLGELFAGLTLGSLVVIGGYIALIANPSTPINELFPSSVVALSIPVGILTSLLLLLNEFPDAEADKKGGRFHLVIALGYRGAATVYVLGMIAVYLSILYLFYSGFYGKWILISLATIPLAVKTSVAAIKYGDVPEKIIPAMGLNVIIVLLTDLLLGIGTLL